MNKWLAFLIPQIALPLLTTWTFAHILQLPFGHSLLLFMIFYAWGSYLTPRSDR